MVFKVFLRELLFLNLVVIIILFFLHADLISAQTRNNNLGDETGLPLPRFVSVKFSKTNVRRGPNLTYQIDWVYTRAGIPLKIIAEFANWRKVEDFQGEGGWIHSRLLSGQRFVIIVDKSVMLKRRPNNQSPAVATIEKGVIGKLISTVGSWCEINVNGYRGWVRSAAVWGATHN